jgi:hypothetical protein
MRTNYSDERLAWLLAHARSGRLAFVSCCCFIGIATADHALKGETGHLYYLERHYRDAKWLPGATVAESAYALLAEDDAQRIRRLIPMIKAEMRRRDRLAATARVQEEVCVG